MPSTACIVQDALGATRAAAFDMNAACSGFVYALSVGTQAITAGSASNVLVIGAETFSRWLDWTKRETCVLFGDGAGAVVLQASDQPGGVLSYALGSDGSGANLLIIRNGGSRVPPQGYLPSDGLLYMNGKEVYRFATRIIGKAVREALERASVSLADINLIIPHQANLRIIEAAAKSLGVPMEKMYINVNRYGNTSAASIPIALCEAVDEGRLQPGDHVCLVGFGAGLTWAAATVKWAPPMPAPQTGVTRRIVRWSRAPLARVKSLIHRAERKIDFWEARQEQRKVESARANGHSAPPNGVTPPTNGHGPATRTETKGTIREKSPIK
jgi:3-oxoacyl-[acyl-carrier-protein] synthase III